MKSLEESVVMAMDGSDPELYPFLPYLLQDLWEIGADPETIIRLLRKHGSNYQSLRVLDLGCGKGAVSVKLAREFGCTCYGIDAIPEFIAFAGGKALEYKVNHLCRFETGDIREKADGLTGYDIVLLGAIGPVFGDCFTTLTTLSDCINEHGFFIIDDAYIGDESEYNHPLILRKSAMLEQIGKAGMKLVENEVMDREAIKDSDDSILQHIRKRCNELMDKFPDKQRLFLDYIIKQEEENDVLENRVTATTMLIKKDRKGLRE